MNYVLRKNPYRVYMKGVKEHQKKNLGKAIKYYRYALEKSPPREPDEKERRIILKFSPILFTTPSEPFPLKDVVAIMHPEIPMIAYHLFWEDDIDYPLDQEPCDHEIIWVKYNEKTNKIETLFTYFHGKIIDRKNPELITKEDHPIINIQWGKHGSLLPGWDKHANGEIFLYMKNTYERLKNKGAKNKDAPLAKEWISYFEGEWRDFIDFSQKVEVEEYLRKKEMMIVGKYANAILKWYFLHYNFNPKYSWPSLDSLSKGIW